MDNVIKIVPNFLDYSIAVAVALLFVFVIWFIFRQMNQERQELVEKINQQNQKYIEKYESLNLEFRDFLKTTIEKNRETNLKVIEAFEMLSQAFKDNTEAIQIFNQTMQKHQNYWDINLKK